MTDNLSKFTGDSMDKSEFQTLEDFTKRYNIQPGTVSVRLKFLNIKPSNNGPPALYNKEQVADMDGLHQHILRTGKKNGYRKLTSSETDKSANHTVSYENLTEKQTLPEESPPVETASYYVEQESIMQLPEESAEINKKSETLSEIDKKAEILSLAAALLRMSGKEIDEFDKQAQLIAVEKQIAFQHLVNYYTITGEFTNPEAIEMVQQRRKQSQQEWEEVHKSFNPKALSQLLIARAKQKAVGQKPTEA